MSMLVTKCSFRFCWPITSAGVDTRIFIKRAGAGAGIAYRAGAGVDTPLHV